ncbi:MAG TPA: hypothetical protein V6D17_04480 [Candidatus Obscuribacterales bacterium]
MRTLFTLFLAVQAASVINWLAMPVGAWPVCTPPTPRFAAAQGKRDYKPIVLDHDVSLPDLPQFTGQHKFSTGIMFPDVPGGPAYILRYSTSAKPKQIIEWYRTSLETYGWKRTSGDEYNIRATKNQNYVTISILSPLRSEEYCYSIRYRSGGRH